ncbi:hypothetical protein LOTGIDRAFT_159434 [Lottia gigantea]|uniref:VWFD domain-containing protein n=1 Tax=Lottia gigantea TaxID=225164 RepID=V4A0S7_LOTGI|nr:hypothetical protein LOTGIDRAFT_159434 [Lottia gigantea]ESO97403.1 hypothetical protein LOTGIDRAFT_159434 [Lottia gigantea]
MKIYILISLASIWFLPLVKSACKNDAAGSKLEFWLTISKDSDQVETVYSKWLNKNRNDAHGIFTALWARLFDYTSSEVSRYRTVSGRLDSIKNARDELKRVCDDWKNSGAKIWPYCALAKDFTCKFYEAVQACYDAGNIGADNQKIASPLGPDTDARSAAINKLFHEDVLLILPIQTIESAFYSSGMVTQTYYKLYQYHRQPSTFRPNTLNNWNKWGQVKQKVTAECAKHGKKQVGIQYYCKAKAIMVLFETCIRLERPDSCTFDSSFQHHWDTGTQFDYWRKSTNVPTIILKLTVEYFLSQVFSLYKNDDYNGLKKHIDQYLPYLNVEGKYCSQGWSQRVPCTDDQCKALWMYRPDCTVKRIADAAKKYVDLRKAGKSLTDQDVKDARDALAVWQIYPHVLEVISPEAVPLPVLTELQKRITNILQPYELRKLTKYLTNFPPARYSTPDIVRKICSPVVPKYSSYCLLEPTINIIQDASGKVQTGVKKVVKLNPQIDYTAQLEQLQLETISNKINKQTKKLFDNLSADLKANFKALANYFGSLANYDKTKAVADIGFIKGSLETFDTKIKDLCRTVGDFIKNIMIGAFVGVFAELVQRTAELTTFIVEAGNPLKWLTGGAIGDILSAIDALAQAGVGVSRVASITANDLPDLVKTAITLKTNFAKNQKFIKLTREVVDGLASGADVEDQVSEFLSMYNNYSPAVLQSDITSYGEKLSGVSESYCETLSEGSSAASAIVEMGIAASGDCRKVKIRVAELVTVYVEMYDYQNDLMTSLSEAARAHLAAKKAEDMKKVYSSAQSENRHFLSQYAVMTMALSIFHVWTIVQEYCNTLVYIHGGQMPNTCHTALAYPSFTNIIDVISYKPKEVCNTNNEIRDYIAINTKPRNDNDTGYVDLEKLYAKESIDIKIKDKQDLLEWKWVDEESLNKVAYIKNFDLFILPIGGMQTHLIRTSVTVGNQNKLQPLSETKYIFETPSFTTRYYENSMRCVNPQIRSPYFICDESKVLDLCITSSGVRTGAIKPSIYNTFTIKVVSLPSSAIVPKPKTDVKLYAGVTFCFVEGDKTKRNVNLKGEKKSKRKITKRGIRACCAANHYFTGSACAKCPGNSVSKFDGYYCE